MFCKKPDEMHVVKLARIPSRIWLSASRNRHGEKGRLFKRACIPMAAVFKRETAAQRRLKSLIKRIAILSFYCCGGSGGDSSCRQGFVIGNCALQKVVRLILCRPFKQSTPLFLLFCDSFRLSEAVTISHLCAWSLGELCWCFGVAGLCAFLIVRTCTESSERYCIASTCVFLCVCERECVCVRGGACVLIIVGLGSLLCRFRCQHLCACVCVCVCACVRLGESERERERARACASKCRPRIFALTLALSAPCI